MTMTARPNPFALPTPIDANKTWRGAGKARLDFGHRPASDGRGGRVLVVYHPNAQALCWADTHTRVSPDQWANMPPRQREELLRLVPTARRPAVVRGLAGGVKDEACEERPRRCRLTATTGREGAFQHRLRRAAKQATAESGGAMGSCYDTANRTAQLACGSDLDGGRGMTESTAARGLPIAHLRTSAQAGSLKVGMAVYMNLAPGTNPRSLNNETRPHWVTYLGKDPDGTMRFSDQFRADWTLAELAEAYAPRQIDLFVDPYGRPRKA